MSHPLSACVPPADWPEDLQEVWTAACRPGSLLRQRGPAATWSEPTKVHVTGGIGNFLFWSRRTEHAKPDVAFADLVTPERVMAYAAARRVEIRDISIRSRLVGLTRGLAVLFPERDWSWIRHIITSIPDGRAASRQRKQPRIRHSLELFDLGLRLTLQAESETDRRPIERAVLFRDGLIIAFLALRPIRRKNAAALVIGVHVVKAAAGWRVFLPAAEVKNRVEYDTDIPAEIGALLDRYLAAYRPILLAAHGQPNEPPRPYLWISWAGKPLSPDAIAQQVCARTTKAFGTSVPPHFFRDCAMTTWAIDLPTKVRGGIHVLGNRSFAIAQSAYNMAGSSVAAAKLQGALANVRRASKTPPMRRRRSAMMRPKYKL
jgi:integrase/recombinase XerD